MKKNIIMYIFVSIGLNFHFEAVLFSEYSEINFMRLFSFHLCPNFSFTSERQLVFRMLKYWTYSSLEDSDVGFFFSANPFCLIFCLIFLCLVIPIWLQSIVINDNNC